MKIKEIINDKGGRVVTMEPHETVKALVHLLTLEQIGALVVCSENNKTIYGIISERDVVGAFTKYGANIQDISVSELMTRDVTTCIPEDDVKDIMGIMTQKRIRHLPVIADERLVGIVSIGDLVKSRMADLQLETNILRDHVVALNYPTIHP